MSQAVFRSPGCLPVSLEANSAGSKRATSNICFPKSKNVFDLNRKTFLLAVGQNVLSELEMFEKFGGASKDTLLKLSHVGQTMLVSPGLDGVACVLS